MIICRGFVVVVVVVVVVVCVTAKYSDHMCGEQSSPSDSLAALSASSDNFSCVPWRAQIIYIIYKPFKNNTSRKNKMQIQYFKTST